jgi:hypothetical protein
VAAELLLFPLLLLVLLFVFVLPHVSISGLACKA